MAVAAITGAVTAGTVGATVGIGSLALGVSSANKASKAAGAQTAALNSQVAIDRDKWEMYRDNIFPIEVEAKELGLDAQQLAYERSAADKEIFDEFYRPLSESFAQDAMEGIKPQYDRVAREARKEVDSTFDNIAGQTRRNLQRRGVMPGSGAYNDPVGDVSLARGATGALAVREAVDRETDRVESENFNRKATALGRTPLNSQPVQGAAAGINAGSSGAGTASAARGFGSQAQMYGDAAAGVGQSLAAIPGVVQQGFDFYNSLSQPAVTANPAGAYQPPVNTSPYTGYQGGGVWAAAEGGQVPEPGYAEVGQVAGAPGVDRVPATIEGQRPARLTRGEYIIPVDVVMKKGTDFFDKLLESGKGKAAERDRSPVSLNRRGGY